MDGMFIDGMERASLEEIERGYIYEEEEGRYTCLICGSSSEQGVIYPSPDEQAWWDAEKWMTKHIVREHGSVFHALLHLDKKVDRFVRAAKAAAAIFPSRDERCRGDRAIGRRKRVDDSQSSVHAAGEGEAGEAFSGADVVDGKRQGGGLGR